MAIRDLNKVAQEASVGFGGVARWPVAIGQHCILEEAKCEKKTDFDAGIKALRP